MKTRSLSAAAVALVAVVTGGCALGANATESNSEVLPPGMAQFTMNGRDVAASESLQCQINGYLTTLEVTNAEYRVTAMVSNAEDLTVEWVRIHDLNGFTGTYSQGLGDDAKVTMTGPTYHITGTAYGFSSADPERVTEMFGMNASC